MSLIKDAVNAMKEVILLSDKVERAGSELSDISKQLRNHGDRLVRLETRLDTLVEIAKSQNSVSRLTK